MIEVYAFATPNSIRVPIMLEELGSGPIKSLAWAAID
jgi:hypothetical protein